MADDIRLKLFLETAQESLKEVKKDVEKALKSVRLKLDTDLSDVAGGFISGPSGGPIQRDIQKVQSKLIDTGAKLIEAQNARTVALRRAIAEATGAADAGQRVSEIQEEHVRRITLLLNRYSKLNQALGGLQQVLDVGQTVIASVSARMDNLNPGAISAAMELLERVTKEAAAAFVQLKGTVGESKAFETAQEQIRQAIGANQKSLEGFGFTVKEAGKLLEIGIRGLVDEIGEVDFKKILEQDLRRFLTSSVDKIELSPQLLPGGKATPKAPISSSAAGLPLEKELKLLQNVARIKAKALGSAIDVASEEIREGGITFLRETKTFGRGLKDATVRILNEAVRAEGALVFDKDGNIKRAEGALVSELFEQVQRLQASVAAERLKENVNKDLVRSQQLMIDEIMQTITSFQSLSRPVQPLANSMQNLILTFGSLPEKLQQFAQSNGLKDFDVMLKRARDLLSKFGTDFQGLANSLIDIPDEVTDEELEKANDARTQLVKLLTNAYKQELNSSKAIAAENNKLVAGRQKRSKTFESDAKPIIDAELALFKAEVKKAIDEFKDAGRGVGRLGFNAEQFNAQLESVKRAFILSLDQSKVAFFDIAEGGATLRNALEKVAGNFASGFEDERERLAKEQEKQQKRLAAVDKKVADAREVVLKKQQELIDAIQKSIIQEANRGAGKSSSTSVIGQIKNLFKKQQDETIKAELKSFADVQRVGQTLDPTGQERFLKALKGEAVSLKELNAVLKQHQGNLAKSSALQDRMTSSLRSGEKAAFQFGFAAANAAERLTAWASPAFFLFETLGLLRESTTSIIKLDSELRKLVFFSPEFISIQIASLKGLDETVKQRIFTDQTYAQSLADSASSSELMVAKNLALAASFDIVINRSRDTGLALDDITSGLLATARVGQTAFERNAENGELIVSSFFRAVEAFKRLEGAAANTDTIVSLLNSTLNEFQISAENAVSVTAAVGDAAARSALEGQELFDVLVRTGGAFNLLTGSSVAESLAVIQRATEANIPSVSKLATALRQFTTLAIENSEAIEKFSGIKLVEAGQIKDMQTFVSVLEKLNELAPAAREEFLSLFSERDTGATILAIATRARELRGDLIELSDGQAAAARASAQTRRFLEQQLFAQEDLTSGINKLKAAITNLIKDSGFTDFLLSGIKGLTGVADTVGGLAKFLSDSVGLFKLLAAVAAPTVFNILKGFRQGFLQRQNSFKVEQEIIDALRNENGIHTAINKAQTEGLIAAEQANILRQQNLGISAQIIKLQAEEEILQAEINALKGSELVQVTRIQDKERQLNAIQEKRATILREELGLRTRIEKVATSSAAKAQAVIGQGFKNALIGIGSVAAFDIIPGAIGDIANKISGSRKIGDTVQNVIQSAVLGAIGGAAFGPLVAALGATVGGIGAIVNARREAGRAAEDQARIQLEADRAASLELKNFNARAEARRKVAEDISVAEKAILATTDQIERLEIEINRVGAEKAEQEGLLVERQRLQETLIRQQLQLKQREKAEIEETIKFEERRTAIRERLLTVEKALGVQRQAELALAKSFNDTKLAVQLELKFDTQQINLQKQALERDLAEVVTRLASIRADVTGGKAQQIKDLEKERLRIEAEIVRNGFDLLAAQAASAEKIADVNTRAAEEQISAWVNASNLVVNAFKSVVSSQIEVTKIMERQGDVLASIIDEEQKLLDRGNTAPGQGLSSSQREQQSLSSQRNSLARQLRNALETFDRQEGELEGPPGVGDIQQQAQAFRDAMRDANIGLGEFARNVELGDRKIFRALENQRASLEANAELARANIANEITFTNKIIDIRRREIEVLGKTLELQQKRNEQDAELGRKLLETPDAFLQEIKNIATAQSFLRGIGSGDTRGIEERIRRLQNNSSGGGFIVLRQVLEGLEAAVKQGLVLNQGFNPEELLQVFSRLQFQSAEDINETTEGEKTLISTMNEIHGTLIDQLDRQNVLLEDERKIQEQIQLNGLQQNSIALAQSDTLNLLADNAIREAGITRDANRELQDKLATQIGEALGELPGIQDVTTGDQLIIDSITALNEIMSEIRDSSPEVRIRREELRELGRLALSSSSIQAPTISRELAGAEIATLIQKETLLTAQLEDLKNRLPELISQRGDFEDIFNSVTGADNTASVEIANVEGAIRDLEFELAELERSRRIFETQLSTLDRIEQANNRMVELQDKLLFHFSNNPTIRASEAEQLASGNTIGTGHTDIANLPRENTPLPVEIVNPTSIIPTNVPAPGDAQSSGTEADVKAAEELQRFADVTNEIREVLSEMQSKFGESTNDIVDFINNLSTRDTRNVEEAIQLQQETLETLRGIREQLADETPSILNFSEESIDEFNDKLKESIGEAAQSFGARIREVPLNVNVSDVNVQLDARVQQQLQGDEFAQQLVAALQGTGLEDRVSDIQGVVAKLVKTALDRGENFDGVDMVGFGDGQRLS